MPARSLSWAIAADDDRFQADLLFSASLMPLRLA
jgi:hypothetical protein